MAVTTATYPNSAAASSGKIQLLEVLIPTIRHFVISRHFLQNLGEVVDFVAFVVFLAALFMVRA